MPTYATVAGVSARMGGRIIDVTSSPSSVDVGRVLDQAEAELLGTLASVGISTSYAAASTGANIISGWVERYVAGLTRQSHAAAGGDGANDDGRPDIDWWARLLERIAEDPAQVGAMLGNGTGSSSAVGVGSHATDAALALTDTDVEATFRRGEFNF